MAIRHAAWSSRELLEQNRALVLRRSLRTMRKCEARYELPSDQAEAEMRAGRLRETAEVCAWIMAFKRYLALQHER